jgi:glycosyltransferase involved in cell wall biosynthesis
MATPVGPLLVHFIASSGFYGAEKVVANLCLLLPEQRTTVFCITSISGQDEPFQKAIDKLEHVRYVRVRRSAIFILVHLIALCRQETEVVLHAHGYKETFYASCLALVLRCRVIVTQHGFTERKFKFKLYNYISKVCCRFFPVEKVIAVSHDILTIYRKFGVPEQRLQYLPNGIEPLPFCDSSRHQRARVALCTRYGLNTEAPLLVYVGRLSKEKNPSLFVQTLAEVQKTFPQAVGMIAGEGPLDNELRAQAKHLELADSLCFLGFVEEVYDVLSACDILVLPSYTEGTPMIILEAMSVGLPVVASAVGDIPDIITPDKDGFLVFAHNPADYAQKCCDILNLDPDTLAALTSKARLKVDQVFNLQQQRTFYQQLYQSTKPWS